MSRRARPSQVPHAVRPPVDRTLRTVLVADAALCIVTGAFLAVTAGPLVRAAGLDGSPSWPVRGAGIALAALGLGLLWLARADRLRLSRLTPWSIEADALWVVGSLVVAGTIGMNGPARAIVIAQAIAVSVLGFAKFIGLRQLRRGSFRDEGLIASRS